MDSTNPHTTVEPGMYTARVDIYDALADRIAAMKTEALANIDYPDHFTRHIEEWSKNYKYMDGQARDLRTAIIGEIAGPDMGTVLRAHGNYYVREGETFKPIDDKDKIKDTLALAIPTAATTKMYNTCLNQINTLGQVTDADADEEARNGKNPFVRNWTKPSQEGSGEHDIIMCHMLPKYAVPTAAGAPKVKRTAKRKLDEAVDGSSPNAATAVEGTAYVPSGDDIRIGAHYEPSLLPDYGGSYFNHVKAKLVQLDVRGVDGALIPPWKFYEALRPGTLVLVLATLHCFIMQDEGKKERARKIYQINAQSVRVLAESNAAVAPRQRPLPPHEIASTSTAAPDVGVSAFANFEIPIIVPGKGVDEEEDSHGDVDMDGGDGGANGSGLKGKGKKKFRKD